MTSGGASRRYFPRTCAAIRDIRRKIIGQAGLETVFHEPLARARQIRSQQQRQRGWKLYSFHAPEVECIGKGKARISSSIPRLSALISTLPG